MIQNPMCLESNPGELSQTTPCTSLIACYADTLPWYTSKEGLNSLSCASEGQNLVAHLRLECTHMAGQNHDWTLPCNRLQSQGPTQLPECPKTITVPQGWIEVQPDRDWNASAENCASAAPIIQSAAYRFLMEIILGKVFYVMICPP